ncbi:MAG: 2-dehydro-3-deoxyglucarate aldolase [Roseivirga sp.]|uniref:HpcH/HpaI aldolase family protein n=1 Tax=Roseivirga sp. TaxID=1964215 RepID=UPI001AFCF582|nr:aldolase/citrate lyase family protein [Roseivirga sp.]MBO6659396.1 2-dehydro-3-deoxyglucarate aldolase [Roseivirga sp.]MBO6763167.1 2-dehydro-3-deoxyglucarate aldolase [Roseivirga sp.]MBO6907867.1 2-dehydro-3-deoxyglucarate aldolase [Roseivirga sp.]
MNFQLRKKLDRGEKLIGTLLSLPSPEIAEIMSMVGFDWLFIDLEHGPHGFMELQRMIQAMKPNCGALVRVPEVSEANIKKVLDIGAEGIIVPKVDTAEKAKQIVSYAKYPIQGVRGVGAARAHGYGLNFKEYVERANEGTLVVIQIEHFEGVNNINEIVEVEGVDVIFIGPYDLSASFGVAGQLEHPLVKVAIEKVEEACAKAGIPMGYFGTNPEAVKPYLQNESYQLITCGTDSGFLIEKGKSVLGELGS